MRIEEVCDGIWDVTSKTQTYQVSEVSEIFLCTCAGYAFYGFGKKNPEFECKHIRAVVEYEKMKI